jgi:hypothetical protein
VREVVVHEVVVTREEDPEDVVREQVGSLLHEKQLGSRAGERRLPYTNPPHHEFFRAQWYEEYMTD